MVDKNYFIGYLGLFSLLLVFGGKLDTGSLLTHRTGVDKQPAGLYYLQQTKVENPLGRYEVSYENTSNTASSKENPNPGLVKKNKPDFLSSTHNFKQNFKTAIYIHIDFGQLIYRHLYPFYFFF